MTNKSPIDKKSVRASIKFIKQIKVLVEKHIANYGEVSYDMENFRKCVLGFHKFDGGYWANKQGTVAREILGISVDALDFGGYYFCDSTPYNEAQWEAIRIFTTDIVHEGWDDATEEEYQITSSSWLEIANDAIKNLEEYLK